MNSLDIRPDGIIESSFVGDQTYREIDDITVKTIELIEKQRKAGKPVLILTSMADMGKIEGDARKLIIARVKSYDVDKIAAFGAVQSKTIATFLTRALAIVEPKLMSKIKLFDDKEQAEAWLKSK